MAISGYGGNKSTLPYQVQLNMPEWQRLGYKSYQEYINATSGASGNKNIIPQWTSTVHSKMPLPGNSQNPSTVKLPSVQTAYGSFVGGGSGGVTNEGTVIGNPKVNNDTFTGSSSGTLTQKVPTAIGGETVTLPTSGLSGTVKKPTAPNTTPVQIPTTPNTTPTQTPTTPVQTVPSGRIDEGSYNGETDFLEWYKTNYGVDYDPSVGFSRREGMNDGVWNVGRNLYNYYTQGLDDEENRASEEANRNKYYDEQLKSLLGEYASSRDSLDKSKRQQQQNASITLDKLKKYLPTQIKSQGLGGLGVSESSMLQAYNNYNNDMGAIESDYQANKTSLDVGENNAKNTLENYRQDALQKIAEKYGAAADARQAEAGNTSKNIFSAYEAQVREQMRQLFEDAYSTISENTSTSVDDIMNYVQQLKGKISDSDYQTLMQYAGTVVQNNKKIEEEEEKKKAENAQTALYNEFMSKITLGVGIGYNTSNELENEYNKIKDKLSENQRQIIEGYLTTIKNNTEQKQIDSDYFKNAFFTNGQEMSQEEAENVLISILNSSADNTEKEKYQEAFDLLYGKSYYTTTNKESVDNKQQYDLYQEMANKGMSEKELSKVDANSIRTSSPFGKWDFYYAGKNGWYCWEKGGVEYWYKKK